MGVFPRMWCMGLLLFMAACDGSHDPNWTGNSGSSGSSDQGAVAYLVPLSQLRALVSPNDLKEFDVSSPPVTLITGTASGSSQPPDIAPPQDPSMIPPGIGPGGPWDLSYLNDPTQLQMLSQGQDSQVPPISDPTALAPSGSGSIQLTAPSGTSITVQQPSPNSAPQTFDIGATGFYRNSPQLGRNDSDSAFAPDGKSKHQMLDWNTFVLIAILIGIAGGIILLAIVFHACCRCANREPKTPHRVYRGIPNDDMEGFGKVGAGMRIKRPPIMDSDEDEEEAVFEAKNPKFYNAQGAPYQSTGETSGLIKKKINP